MQSLFSESLSLLLFVAGALLLVAEALAPGAHFFVVGVALLTAGIVGLAVPAGGILAPFILAVVVLGVTAITLWGYRTLDIYGGEGAARTSDSSSLRGSFGYVTERVTRHEGEVKLDDGGFNPYYRARTEDAEIDVGEQVMVVDPGGGNVVTVTPVTTQDDIERELEKGREEESDAPPGAAGDRSEDAEDSDNLDAITETATTDGSEDVGVDTGEDGELDSDEGGESDDGGDSESDDGRDVEREDAG